MSDRIIVGLQPRLPAWLQFQWLTQPVPAERLGALRIGTGLVLLADVALTYWPFRHDYFGPGSLTEPDVFADRFQSPFWNWSLLRSFPAIFTPEVTCIVWMLAAALLILGVFPRMAAAVAWAMAVSVNNTAAYLGNSGDLLRQHLLFFLMLTPCGAAYSLGRIGKPKALVAPWALRILFVELVCMYFFNGVYKLARGANWQHGTVMHHVLHTPGWCRWSPPFDLPAWCSVVMTVFVLAWELLFPALVVIKPLRLPALLIGVGFHIETFFHLEIGPFGLYALCLYLPLVPWERRRAPTHLPQLRRETVRESEPCALV